MDLENNYLCCDIISKNKDSNVVFKYKNNIYILNEDIRLNESIYLEKEGKEIISSGYLMNFEKDSTYVSKVRYEVKKGPFVIDSFETREEAEKLVDDIFNQITSKEE